MGVAATETATLDAENATHHGLHLFEDLLLAENVDVQKRRR